MNAKTIKFLFSFLNTDNEAERQAPTLGEVGAAMEYWNQNYQLVWGHCEQENQNFQYLDRQCKKLKRDLAKSREECESSCVFLAQQKYNWIKGMHNLIQENSKRFMEENNLSDDLNYFIQFAEKELDVILQGHDAGMEENYKTEEEMKRIESALSEANEIEKRLKELKCLESNFKKEIEKHESGENCKQVNIKEIQKVEQKVRERKQEANELKQAVKDSLVKNTDELLLFQKAMKELGELMKGKQVHRIRLIKRIEENLNFTENEKISCVAIDEKIAAKREQNCGFENLILQTKHLCEDLEDKLKRLSDAIDEKTNPSFRMSRWEVWLERLASLRWKIYRRRSN